jgi:O-antigen ligase/tetratricopeptide (TPR) repeat protein
MCLLGSTLVLLFAGLWENPGVTADPPGLFMMAGGALLVCVGGVLIFFLRIDRLRLAALGLFSGFLVWSLICSRNSLDPFLSRVCITQWVLAFGVFSSLLVGVTDRNSFTFFVKGIAILACFFTGLGLGPVFAHGGNLQSTFTNPDCFSVVPLVGVLLALGTIDRLEGKWRLFFMAVIPFLTVGVILTGSRSGFAGLVTGWIVFAWLGRGRESARPVLAVVVATPLLAVLLLFATGQSDLLTSRWQQLWAGKDRVGIQARTDVFVYGLRAVAQRPVTGSGPGTFHLAYQAVRPTHRGEAYMNVAHDDYMQILVETGGVGLLLWISLLLGSLALGVVHSRRSSTLQYQGATAAVAAVTVYALANFAVPVAADLCLWISTLALCIVFRQDRLCGPLPCRLVGIWMMGLGLLGAFQGYGIHENNVALISARLLRDRLEWGKALSVLAKRENTNDLRILLARADNAERLGIFNADPHKLDDAVGDLRHALDLDPVSLDAMVDLASLLERRDQYAPALALLLKARSQTPQSPQLDADVARNYLLQGQFEEAIRALRSDSDYDDPAALGDLIVIIDHLHPGKGKAILKNLLSADAALGARSAARAGSTAQALKDPKLAASYYKILLARNPRYPGANLSLARLESAVPIKLSLLERELKIPDNDEGTLMQALQLWAPLTLSRGESRRVAPVLEHFLAKHPQETNLRLLLSQTYSQLKLTEDARRVLRDGLDHDRDGSLYLALGNLFEAEGNSEIALSYYQDARRLNEQSPAILSAIARVQGQVVQKNSTPNAANGTTKRPTLDSVMESN